MSTKKNIQLFLWTLLIGAAACSAPPSDPKPPVVGAAALWLSDTIVNAGTPVAVIAWPESGPGDDSWQLIWSDAYGDAVFVGRNRQDTIRFSIPERAFQRSGLTELTLCQRGEIMDRRHLAIRPGPAEGVIETYAGARTMVVNSEQRAMVVAIPKDQYGNPVAHDTPVEYALRYPGQAVTNTTDPTESLVSSILVESQARAGKILVAAAAAGANSIEETIELTPGWPEPFTLETESWLPYADSRQQVILRTGFIRDAFGNRVADGTFIHLVVEEAGRVVARYRGITSSGAAQVHLENPDRATTWQIYALAEGGIRSNTLTLAFAPYVQAFDFRYDPEKRAVVVGPIAGNLGQMVTDDLVVALTLTDPDTSYRFSGVTENGFCAIPLPGSLPEGIYQCALLAGGRERTGELVVNR